MALIYGVSLEAWILVNALFYFSCTFVNVLSCLSVKILSLVEEIKNIYLLNVGS